MVFEPPSASDSCHASPSKLPPPEVSKLGFDPSKLHAHLRQRLDPVCEEHGESVVGYTVFVAHKHGNWTSVSSLSLQERDSSTAPPWPVHRDGTYGPGVPLEHERGYHDVPRRMSTRRALLEPLSGAQPASPSHGVALWSENVGAEQSEYEDDQEDASSVEGHMIETAQNGTSIMRTDGATFTQIDFRSEDSVVKYLTTSLHYIDQNAVKQVLTDWIKVIQPKKQSTYPYKEDMRPPPWWPPGIQHREPAHSSKAERTALSLHIAFLYREKELCHTLQEGPRKAAFHGRWTQLLQDATTNTKLLFQASNGKSNPELEQMKCERRRLVMNDVYSVLNDWEMIFNDEKDNDFVRQIQDQPKTRAGRPPKKGPAPSDDATALAQGRRTSNAKRKRGKAADQARELNATFEGLGLASPIGATPSSATMSGQSSQPQTRVFTFQHEHPQDRIKSRRIAKNKKIFAGASEVLPEPTSVVQSSPESMSEPDVAIDNQARWTPEPSDSEFSLGSPTDEGHFGDAEIEDAAAEVHPTNNRHSSFASTIPLSRNQSLQASEMHSWSTPFEPCSTTTASVPSSFPAYSDSYQQSNHISKAPTHAQFGIDWSTSSNAYLMDNGASFHYTNYPNSSENMRPATISPVYQFPSHAPPVNASVPTLLPGNENMAMDGFYPGPSPIHPVPTQHSNEMGRQFPTGWQLQSDHNMLTEDETKYNMP